MVGKYLTSVAEPKAKVTVRALNYEQIFTSVGKYIHVPYLTVQCYVCLYSYKDFV